MHSQLKERIRLMRARLDNARPVIEIPAESQLFVTPAPVCDRLVTLAEISNRDHILEPSAGTGAILRAIRDTAPGAMCDAVENAFGFRPGIKWTNDLVVGTKKLGGILTELGLDPKTGRVSYAVLGIGINCAQLPGDFDESIRNMATSARMVLGKEPDRERLIAEMVLALEGMELHSPAHMLERYRRDCITLGKPISIVRGDEVRHALALDVDCEGGLVVRYDSGETGTVTSGEVSVRGLYGYI